MPISPIITFKAGQCDVDASEKPFKVKPQPKGGYVYLYSEDDLVHFCWRGRDEPLDEPELDLVMVPTDGTFLPYEASTVGQSGAKTNGRIFVLKFASSSQRHLFWMQSKPQAQNGDASWFSPRDRKIGDIVNRLLQGEEVNVTQELSAVRNVDDRRDEDDDEQMEDAEGGQTSRGRHGSGSGGAGADATGGDVREEGEESREGGSDGARAALGDTSAADAVRRFMESMRDHPSLPSGQQQQQQSRQNLSYDVPYPHLNHLLHSSTTIPWVNDASVKDMDRLLMKLPWTTVLYGCEKPIEPYQGRPENEVKEELLQSLSEGDKRRLLQRVLRSPQIHQALGTLTMALRDGGLPSVAEALHVDVENRGYINERGIPLGGGAAVKSFVDGVKKSVEKKDESP